MYLSQKLLTLFKFYIKWYAELQHEPESPTQFSFCHTYPTVYKVYTRAGQGLKIPSFNNTHTQND